MEDTISYSTFPVPALKEWFLNSARSLPWRQNPTPYSVWISEIMLQQTQANVVEAYFETWMQEFPTIIDLAKSPIEKVLKIWEGLGYYSRARFIHAAAVQIVKEYNGHLPCDPKELAKIKGIGPYTQGAILSFAFHQKAAAVDGNVLRVISRYFAIQKSVDLPKTKKRIEEMTLALLPDNSPWLLMEALIELGALICKKKPSCTQCPIQESCLAKRHCLQTVLPLKKTRQAVTLLERWVAVILCKGKYLLQRGEKGKIMADLCEFPYIEKRNSEMPISLFEKKLGLKLKFAHSLPIQQHSFTRYRVKLFPCLLHSETIHQGHMWKSPDEMQKLPFSSGHKKILKKLIHL